MSELLGKMAESLIAGKINEVVGLGIDKEAWVFVDTIKELNAKLIGMSALLPPHAEDW